MAMALAEGQGKNWPKAKNALAEGQSHPQELEVSPRSGLYLLVIVIAHELCIRNRLKSIMRLIDLVAVNAQVR